MSTFTIHNIESKLGKTIEDICKYLMLTYTVQVTSVEADLLTYEIKIDHLHLVPFTTRFFHKVDACEYERIEII